jgi:hypothetical protein
VDKRQREPELRRRKIRDEQREKRKGPPHVWLRRTIMPRRPNHVNAICT